MLRCALLLLAVVGLVVPASMGAEVTETVDSFESPFVGGVVGPIPPGWTFLGYGPPAFSAVDGLTTDGTQSYKYAVPIDSIASECPGYDPQNPDPCTSGTHLLYQVDVSVDDMASQMIDWTQPVTVEVDVNGFDPSVGGAWDTLLDIQGYDGTLTRVEFGDDGATNGTWQVVGKELDPGQSGQTGVLLFGMDFAFNLATDSGEAGAIFDNLRITYTPLPTAEVCDNGFDDDQDGDVDCDDADCADDPACPCNPLLVFDHDSDGDVDHGDFAFMQSCLTGPGPNNPVFATLSLECQCLDIAGAGATPDEAIDQQDYSVFEDCASGPGIPADDTCDD